MAKLGDILIQRKWLTQEQLSKALQESARNGGELLGKTLLRLALITESQFLEALAEQLCIPFSPNLQNLTVAPEVVKAVPAKFVWHYQFMPLSIQGSMLTIAVSDPLAVWALEDLKLHIGFDVQRVLATQQEIVGAIRRYYGLAAETVEEILTHSQSAADQIRAEQEAPADDIDKGADQVSVIKLVNQILLEAVHSRATDIHIEFYKDEVRIRYRIDGVMYNVRMPEELRFLHRSIVSRIKILANLNVVENRLPQDGRAMVRIQDKKIDLRVSIIPSLNGENVVIRILPVHLLLKLEELGFEARDLQMMDQLTQKPHGIIFLTGPTGSGKTTSLYACLTRLNKEGTKIITIEDPVEYELKGVMQIQVRAEIGFTFANALRSVLRHDPDIMMVGEVRDLETAELAIRTALTGHLIFSTLHTNDACSGGPRLIDIGIEPYLVASSVEAFISQRLVRVICLHCKRERRNRDSVPVELKDQIIFEGAGCENCQMTGYKGRIAIYEILLMNEELRKCVLNKAPASEIMRTAKQFGFHSLRDAGLLKVCQGLTTPEEVLRVSDSTVV